MLAGIGSYGCMVRAYYIRCSSCCGGHSVGSSETLYNAYAVGSVAFFVHGLLNQERF